VTGFLLRLVVNTVAVLIASALLAPSYFAVPDVVQAIVLALVLGLLNAVVRPILTVVTFPLHLLTFGLFALVLNGLILWLVASLVPGVSVGGFGGAFLAALIMAVVSAVASRLIS
jgi:putative membrane protein